MPYRRGYRRRSNSYGRRGRKRRYRRTRFARDQAASIALSRPQRYLSFPAVSNAALKWAYQFDFNMTSGGPVTHSIRLNGPYDPLVAVGGDQPAGYDWYQNLYTFYCCYGARVKISAYNIPSNQAEVLLACAPVKTTGLYGGVPLDAAQGDGAISRLIAINGGISVMSKYYDIANLLGVSKQALLTDDSYQALGGSLPGTQVYIDMVAQPNQATTTNMSIVVEIIYYVQWRGKKQKPDA